MAVSPFDYEAKLVACARGDQEAFQQLYLHEAPHMLALALKMLSQGADAQELVRDTFVLIWKNASSFDKTMGTARAWMYSIMRYRATNRLRQLDNMRSLDKRWLDALPDLSENTHASGSVFLQALARLDNSQRQPIVMAFYHGCTYEQMATLLHAPAAKLKACAQAGLGRIHLETQA
jgi:RNA polymerase sigma-70 factor (ECF subfamily)